MPRVTPQHELDLLVALIGTEPVGVAIETLMQKLGHRLQLRTLQRRLALLVEQGRIERLGERRATRYRRLPEAAAGQATGPPQQIAGNPARSLAVCLTRRASGGG